ncbi:MAG: CotH kinase family protein [Myxococcota bacterium]
MEPSVPLRSLRHAVVPLAIIAFGCASANISSSDTGRGGSNGSGGGSSGGATAAGGAQQPSMGGTSSPTLGGAFNSSQGGAPAAGGSNSGGNASGGASNASGGAATGGVGGSTSSNPLIGNINFSTPSQSFKGELSVALSTALPNAEIRYTTDGSLPTASSTLYAGAPITLNKTTQLRAQAFSSGAALGLPSTGIFIARTFDLSSKLPIVLLDGYGKGQSTDKAVYKDAGVMVFEPVNGTASLSALPTLAARAGYHLRGQSSATFPQKPYKLEFRDNADADAKYSVLGMTADADWALIAPYYDRALIRNPFTYTLAKEMGRQAPNTRYAEVYLNYQDRPIQDSDYQGIYWITETIKINNHRLDLKKLDPADTTLPKVSGGYIFKFDQLATDKAAPKLTCTASSGVTCWSDCEVVDPDPLPAAEQLTWLTQYVQSFHNTLFENPIGNYAQFIDVASFVDDLIINELTRNVDAYVRSSFYHKDRDGLLQGGPYWDYNFALGVGGQNTISPTGGSNDGGWQYQGRTPGSLPMRNVNSWFPKLMSDPSFVAQVKTRWKALRGGLLSQSSLEQRISMLTAQLDTAAVARDYAKWPVSMVLPNGRNGIVYGPSVPTWEEQVRAMRDFVVARSNWIDTQWQ